MMGWKKASTSCRRRSRPTSNGCSARPKPWTAATIPRQIIPLAPGEELPFGKNRFVRPFPTFHRVPSQGYTVWERRTGCGTSCAIWTARAGADAARRRAVDEAHEVPLLSFTGDTRVEVLERTPELQRTETLIIETTFLDERVAVADAREMGHIHLDELSRAQGAVPAPRRRAAPLLGALRLGGGRPTLRQRLPAELASRVRLLGPTPRSAPDGGGAEHLGLAVRSCGTWR